MSEQKPMTVGEIKKLLQGKKNLVKELQKEYLGRGRLNPKEAYQDAFLSGAESVINWVLGKIV